MVAWEAQQHVGMTTKAGRLELISSKASTMKKIPKLTGEDVFKPPQALSSYSILQMLQFKLTDLKIQQ